MRPADYFMSIDHIFARNLAAAFMAGPWTMSGLLARGKLACGRRERWLQPLIRRVLTIFEEKPLDGDTGRLTWLIESTAGFGRAHDPEDSPPHRIYWFTRAMSPSPWPVPAVPTVTALAEWLSLDPAKLAWFTVCHGSESKVEPGPLRHYSYRWLRKKAQQWRLLESPKRRLKAIQRKILHDILDRIPPHNSAHGYLRDHSIATFAAPHCGRRIVLRFDLRHFFPSVRRSRVHAVFTTAGYPGEVARLLTGLCVNRVPDDVWQSYPGNDYAPLTFDELHRFQSFHLPQGAPTSPALANLCAYRLDCRLHSLAESVGAQYTRYADDLAFSGDRELERMAKRFQVLIYRIVLDEGFELHLRKSRFMRQGVRQQLVGIVVNAHLNFRRAEFDRLKAILHNCVLHGPATQNRADHADFRSHLLGRIAHVTMLNEARGRKLRDAFNRINWPDSTTPNAHL